MISVLPLILKLAISHSKNVVGDNTNNGKMVKINFTL
jgi:hypothetical protein